MRVFFLYVATLFLFSCPSPNYIPTDFQYSEYQCPEPIGVIVRENCRENLIKYQAEDVNVGIKGSVTGVATAEGTFKNETKVLQDASEFMQFLKDQQVSLCNDYNTCKLTTAEYRERKDRISKTFTTVYALTKQIKVESLDPETKNEIMKKILSTIDEFNKPLPEAEKKSGHKIEFKPSPAKARDYQTGSVSPSRSSDPSNVNAADVFEQLDEAQRQMIKMQQKALEINKKAIKGVTDFDTDEDPFD